MFDLHMHTNLSDGELSVSEVVERLEAINIEVFAITDHNHALAYNEIDNKGLKMIKGTELTSSYNGTIIEFLGFHIDPKMINDWYNDFYSDENIIRKEYLLFEELKDLARSLGYNIPQDLKMRELVKGESKKTVFYYLQESNSDFEWKTYKEFFRKGLSNPGNPWFIDEGRYYPSPEEIINLIHDAGGMAFLAHPYEYGFDDLDSLFANLIKQGIDGIECFHPSATMLQSVKLVKYANEHNIYGSGGSDFHRDARGIPHGVHCHRDLLKTPAFDWLKEYLR